MADWDEDPDLEDAQAKNKQKVPSKLSNIRATKK